MNPRFYVENPSQTMHLLHQYQYVCLKYHNVVERFYHPKEEAFLVYLMHQASFHLALM